MDALSASLPPEFQRIEQARDFIDPWVKGFDGAYDIYSEWSSHLKTQARVRPEELYRNDDTFDETFSNVVQLVLMDSAQAYHNYKALERGSEAGAIDSDVISETVLSNSGYAVEDMTALSRVSRHGLFSKPAMASFQPRIITNPEMNEGDELVHLKMHGVGYLAFKRTETACSIEIIFSEMDNTKLGKRNMLYPFKGVETSFVRSISGKFWDFERGFGLVGDYKALGFQDALKAHPILAKGEAVLLKAILDLWCDLPEDKSKANYDYYSKLTLEAGFQLRLFNYVSTRFPEFAKGLKLGDPFTYRKIAEHLQRYADTSNYIQGSLFR
ncbi:MAG: hypothetical protein QG570_122 [Patescibacteria group bacterium]|nr:hypothetical protein [Patescibacteria group bacterium]